VFSLFVVICCLKVMGFVFLSSWWRQSLALIWWKSCAMWGWWWRECEHGNIWAGSWLMKNYVPRFEWRIGLLDWGLRFVILQWLMVLMVVFRQWRFVRE
jgi:hypothetical protein